jgi:CRISPR/Cas system-associated exonuclease Cas4 (RecB family)
MTRPTRVSFSAIRTWVDCPASYKFSYIDQLPDPAGEAAARGTRLHLSGELFLKGKLGAEELPVDYWRVKQTMLAFKKSKAKAEEVWCVNKNWEKCSEIDEQIWFKAIIDVHFYVTKGDELHIVDLKTGKIYDSHVEQLQLYATLGLIHYPKAKIAHVSGLYIDQGKSDSHAAYRRSMLPHLIKHWDEKANLVIQDEVFLPSPSESKCKYCAFSKKRGGPCDAGV